jgi:hypothetical protein
MVGGTVLKGGMVGGTVLKGGSVAGGLALVSESKGEMESHHFSFSSRARVPVGSSEQLRTTFLHCFQFDRRSTSGTRDFGQRV